MTTLLDYVTKAQDAQYSALSKGSDIFFQTADRASALMDKAPKTPDVLTKAAKPLFSAMGTPGDLMEYAKSSTERLTSAVASFQGRLVDVVNDSAVEKFAARAAQA